MLIQGLEFKRVKIDLIDPPLIIMHEDSSYLREHIKGTGGLIHCPILSAKEDGRYQCICGYARIQELKKLGYSEVDAFIGRFTNEEAVKLSLIENKARREPDPIAEAKAVKMLESIGMKTVEIAKSIGVDRKWVYERKLFCKSPQFVKEDVEKGVYGISHILAIMRVPPEKMERFVNEIKEGRLTVEEAERRSKVYCIKGEEEEYIELERRHEAIKRILPYSEKLRLNWRDYRGAEVEWKGIIENDEIKISVNTFEEAEEALRHEHLEYNLDVIRRPVIELYNSILKEVLSDLEIYFKSHVKSIYSYLSNEEQEKMASDFMKVKLEYIKAMQERAAMRSHQDADRLTIWLLKRLTELKLV